MSKLISRAFLFGILFMVSCENGNQPHKDVTVEAAAQKVTDSLKTLSDIETTLVAADSLQILYYDDPEGDSLRYSRFFHYTISTDSLTINTMKEEFRQSPEIRNALRNCRAEGKIYLYGKGKELKTVYFSTKPGACGFLYIIKNGNFYYVSLGKSFKDILETERKESVKP